MCDTTNVLKRERERERREKKIRERKRKGTEKLKKLHKNEKRDI